MLSWVCQNGLYGSLGEQRKRWSARGNSCQELRPTKSAVYVLSFMETQPCSPRYRCSRRHWWGATRNLLPRLLYVSFATTRTAASNLERVTFDRSTSSSDTP